MNELQASPVIPAKPRTSDFTLLLIFAAVCCLIVAVVFAFKGYNTLYDDSYAAKIVGGDAYNYIIYAGRGTALICMGIVFSVIGVTFAVFASIVNQRYLRTYSHS
jgi:hypothetical protein